ncbi:hypothetical protein SUGI_0076990 [Cryptomeria japonica]|nr:hypothetical protein SUGI_0076990 [Cryptomeria japonica]
MNVDGASKGNPGLSGYGAIIRYEKGEFIGAVTGQEGFVSNNIAEITALEEGLKWATANGLTKVVIEGDSKVVINEIINKHFLNWRLGSWIPRIYDHLLKLEDYQIHHTYREGNQVADLLANHGLDILLPTILSTANAVNSDIL